MARKKSTTKPNDGGPAFPDLNNFTDGMSLRDYFAAKALVVLMKDDVIMLEEVAMNAYAMADAMLQERAKP